MNQFTEQFSILDLARMVSDLTGIKWSCIPNPRVEMEEHYYNAKHSALKDLGLTPKLLDSESLENMYKMVYGARRRINKDVIMPTVRWKQ